MTSIDIQYWSMVGTWLAGFGTLLAVAVALWTSKQNNKILLKIIAGHRTLIQQGVSGHKDYCMIRIVNIGIKVANIVSIGWVVGRGKNKRYFSQILGFPESDTLPKILNEGETANILIPLDNWTKEFSRDILSNQNLNIIKTLKVTVYTSSGEEFQALVEDGLIDKLTVAGKNFSN